MLLAASRASAYPELPAGGAARCDQCHLAPAGGGLLNADGRRAVGTELSSFSGEGTILHGAVQLPDWLSLGANLRSTYAARDVQDAAGITRSLSPLQAQAQIALSLSGWTLYGSAATRGDLGETAPMVPTQNYQPVPASQLVSPEHWLMWRSQTHDVYLRAGRFFAPYGLQLAESVTYVRRDLGFNELEESYALSGGYLGGRWRVEATGFARDFVRHFGGSESGGAAYAGRLLLSGRAIVAVQGKFAVRAGSERTIGGAFAKYYAPALQTSFFVEADVIRFSVDRLPPRDQAIGLAGGTVTPARGLLLTALAEHYQEDLAVRDAARSAATLLLDWFPYPHFEARIMTRAEFPAGGQTTKLLLAQLHYFL
jgi:hypothetical protein